MYYSNEKSNEPSQYMAKKRVKIKRLLRKRFPFNPYIVPECIKNDYNLLFDYAVIITRGGK